MFALRSAAMPVLRSAPLLALLLLGGCVSGYGSTYAPNYPPGYDAGMGSGQYYQPGDQFGGQNVASIDVFYSALAPYGRWVDSRYGRGFQPRTAAGWRPYVNGRWGENRLWISDDPWGWATDHYGRWGHDDRIGWVWIPDTQWAPSWVAWRDADDVTGWAPIPPGIAYSVGFGFGSGWGYDNWNSWYAPSWVWVPRSYLYRPGFGGAVLPWNNGFNYWGGSRWNHNPGWNNGWNGGWNGGWNNGRNGGWNGNRTANRRPDAVRPGTSLPRDGQPGYDRPPRGEWNGDRNGNRREPGRVYARPVGGTWQPRPDDSPGRIQRPDDSPGRIQRPDGSPGRIQRADGNPGRMPRPDGAPRVASVQPQDNAPLVAPRPPRAERPSYAPPPPREERSSAPPREERPAPRGYSVDRRYERPQ